MMSCGIDGSAVVSRVDGNIEWVQADPAIHVSAEVLAANTDTIDLVREKYDVGEWCHEFRAYHATLRIQP